MGIRVKLKKDFSIIRETLERIGIKNDKTKKFYPSCYCVSTNEENMYSIVHFKELFKYVGRESTFEENDRMRLRTIVQLLVNWDLVDPIDDIGSILKEKMTVLKKEEKHLYEIIHKFKFTKKIVIESK